MGRETAENGFLTRLWHWLSPPVPAPIRHALQQAQFDSVRKQVPMLLSVAALNTAIIMAVCAHDGMPPSRYLWMSVIIFYCAVRIAMWISRMRRPLEETDVPRLLRMNVGASLVMITILGVATTYTFVAGTFYSLLLIPMSLGLYTLRPAAIGTIFMGLFPSSIAMILIGPFEAQMLGVAMISVGVLMVRFVAEQYDQLISSLMLADANRRLALTDPLTGLANRRSIMATLDDEVAAGGNFAVALIDLDGFKAVNDSRGHHAGDQLLCAIAERLCAGADHEDEVGRLGGDEFIVLFRNAQDEAECSARANALLGALCRPVEIGEGQLRFGASLGFAVHGLHGDSVEQLLHSADEALYAAKRASKNANPAKGRSARLAA
jgi:diguanylate cyclase